MAHYEYYSNMRTIMESNRASHASLIKRVCSELGQPERTDDMVRKYIDDSIRIKKFKDPKAPKRPRSGYMLYCEKTRDGVRKSLPKNASFADIIKKMAKHWGILENDKKESYNKLAEEDKVRYAKELEDYNGEIYSSNVGSSD